MKKQEIGGPPTGGLKRPLHRAGPALSLGSRALSTPLSSIPTQNFNFSVNASGDEPTVLNLPALSVSLSPSLSVIASLQVLFDRLANPQLLEHAARLRIGSRLEKLKRTMLGVQELLNDAENKQIHSVSVKRWLEDLRDWAYDAEDILDEFATRTEVRPLLTGLKPSDVVFRFKMASKIDKIYSRITYISGLKGRLGLETGVCDDTGKTSVAWQRPPLSTSHAFHSSICGREADEKKIVGFLLSGIGTGEGSSGASKLGVIPIVGMGGIGKTTLARHVFRHSSVQKHFQLKAWVCVSSQFDAIRLTKAILGEFSVPTDHCSELNQLQSVLADKLWNKKFLLVLDDVWTTDYNDWERLRSPFGVAGQGSKVMITTRHEDVAAMMRTVGSHSLEKLSDDYCWYIFLRHAFENQHSIPGPAVVSFRKKILDRCKGLPLAAKVLGGLLRNRQLESWEAIVNSEIWDLWDLSKSEDDIFPTLRFSYYHLPSHLKRCFSYCSVLPKNYEFGEREVVLLWMAEGLIPPSRQQEPEDLGCQYFQELLSRSLFQYSSVDKSRFVMHDCVNDLARFVAGKSLLRLDDDPKKTIILENARHMSYLCSSLDGKMRFQMLDNNVKCLRAFLPFDLLNARGERELTNYVPFTLLPKLRCLRVLSLKNYSVRKLPQDIGQLIHLRYIDLSHTAITRLPESTSGICNLQTLKLEGCGRLKTLPLAIRKLTYLRHLDFSSCSSLQGMPIGMGELTSLRTLSNFIVGQERGYQIGELANLKHIEGNIFISKLENVNDAMEAKEANLRSKRGIRKLELGWACSSLGHLIQQDSSVAFDILVELHPHQNLEILRIHGYTGLVFPEWIANETSTNVRVLVLENCECCTILPPLGKLPALEVLEIINFSSLRKVGKEFYGGESFFGCAFPSLKSLRFGKMGEWEDWWHPPVSSGCFPRLGELYIENCRKLVIFLPRQLLTLFRLDIKWCRKVVIRTAMELDSLKSVNTLKIDHVEALECFYGDAAAAAKIHLLPSLSELEIRNVDVSESAYGALRRNSGFVGACHMMLNSLISLKIVKIPKITLLPASMLGELSKLRQLVIEECENLILLWEKGEELLNSLQSLNVRGCNELVCLFQDGGGGGGGEEEGIMRQQQGLPCGLVELQVEGCDKLAKLPGGLHTLTSLRRLDINDCQNLSCLLDTGFPPFLEDLWIWGCSSLIRLTSMDTALPVSLKKLEIYGCQKLESVVTSWAIDDSSSLESVWIWACGNLKSLPDGIHKLRRLKLLLIVKCSNLRGLPPNSITQLEDLRIDDWPAGMASIGEAVPANLKSLRIYSTRDSINIKQWGIHRLTSLTSLRFGGPSMASILAQNDDDTVILPPSVTDLRIRDFPDLKKLHSKAFQNLNSLQTLCIWNCPKLTSIPQQLLPPTLVQLYILECPLLKQRFANKRGQYRPKVAFIPSVDIDGRSIFDLES